MNIVFKIWLWRISLKINRLGGDEKIGFLANELIKAVQDSGRQVALPVIGEGYGSLDVNVHRAGTESASGHVDYQCGKHRIDFVPTFGEFKIL